MKNEDRDDFQLHPPRTPVLGIHSHKHSPAPNDQCLVWALTPLSDDHTFHWLDQGNELLLVGKCSEFQNDVARVCS